MKISKKSLIRSLKEHDSCDDFWKTWEDHFKNLLDTIEIEETEPIETIGKPCICGNRSYTAFMNNTHFIGCPALDSKEVQLPEKLRSASIGWPPEAYTFRDKFNELIDYLKAHE